MVVGHSAFRMHLSADTDDLFFCLRLGVVLWYMGCVGLGMFVWWSSDGFCFF